MHIGQRRDSGLHERPEPGHECQHTSESGGDGPPPGSSRQSCACQRAPPQFLAPIVEPIVGVSLSEPDAPHGSAACTSKKQETDRLVPPRRSRSGWRCLDTGTRHTPHRPRRGGHPVRSSACSVSLDGSWSHGVHPLAAFPSGAHPGTRSRRGSHPFLIRLEPWALCVSTWSVGKRLAFHATPSFPFYFYLYFFPFLSDGSRILFLLGITVAQGCLSLPSAMVALFVQSVVLCEIPCSRHPHLPAATADHARHVRETTPPVPGASTSGRRPG
ncbi:hypothetical protein VTK73DRAFT_3362 [Phialemonium thermophilum]|uniref:Uncharacterized protein n=1 Tax=Phialemonium thermophilum TaxID=223376 RepID=A0ABR3VIZ9_9PEZI